METLEESHAGPVSIQQGNPRDPSGNALRLAYLLSQYPAVSHTFLLQEVLGLRARGLHIETASINPPDRPLNKLPPEEARESRATRYIKGGRASLTLGLLLNTALLHPGVVLRGLRTILRLPPMTLRQRAFWLFYLGEALLVGQWMRERGLRHLHVHFGGAVAGVGMLVSTAWKIPYSLTIHGPEELLNLQFCCLREKVDQAAFVLCISDFCRSQICQITDPASWSKLRVARLGVDPAMLTPALRVPEPTRPAGSRIPELVCVGRLVPAKGHFILLQALHLLSQRGISLRTTLVGAGPERDRLEQFAARNLPPDAVLFTSALSHPETLQVLRGADLFALASFAEGIPVALMEAMSLGIPCVSTSIAGIPELIRSGVDGLLVAPANVEALADALASLAQDPVLRRRLGASGRQRVLAEYNLPLNQEHLAQCLQDLVRAAAQPEPTRATQPEPSAHAHRGTR